MSCECGEKKIRKLKKYNCVIMLLHHCECGGLDAYVKTVHETLRAVSVGKENKKIKEIKLCDNVTLSL